MPRKETFDDSRLRERQSQSRAGTEWQQDTVEQSERLLGLGLFAVHVCALFRSIVRFAFVLHVLVVNFECLCDLRAKSVVVGKPKEI
jgi:ABC-type Fe3+ transport system permease subunit